MKNSAYTITAEMTPVFGMLWVVRFKGSYLIAFRTELEAYRYAKQHKAQNAWQYAKGFQP